MVFFKVHGHWSMWNAWTECNATCKSTSEIHRTRECSDPAPLHHGKECTKNDNSVGLGEKATSFCINDDLCPGKYIFF